MADRERGAELVEASLRPAYIIRGRLAPQWDLAERLAFYHVPGASVAVIDGGELAWARGYGVAEQGGEVRVTPEHLFQAASISKPVAALGALRLVQAGRLDLDADVNGCLRSWQVPAHGYREHPVTLRGLLSHSAGLAVHGFMGYEAGDAVPTLRQVLDGEPPANSAPIRVQGQPGSDFDYSGGGYVVLQQLLEDVTGRPFAALLHELVLEPAGMAASTFAQPLGEDEQARAVCAHEADGSPLAGRWHVYPELAAAGLWTTAGDLARFCLALMRAAEGRDGAVLGRPLAREMLTRQAGGWGLGLQIEDGAGVTGFSHGGGNAGFACLVTAYPATGQGAAVMTNGENGNLLMLEIVRGVAAAYGWPEWHPEEKAIAVLDPAAIRSCEGTYRSPENPDWSITIRREGMQLYAHFPGRGLTFEIFAESDTRFFACEDDVGLEFGRDAAGRVTELVVGGQERLARAD